MKNRFRAILSDGIFKELFRLVSSTLLIRIAGILIGFGFAMLVSRGVSAEAYGQYSILLAWMLPLSALAGLGTDKLALKHIPGHISSDEASKAAGMYRQARRVTWMFSLLIVALLFSLEMLFEPDWLKLDNIVLLLLAIPVFALLILNCFVLKAIDRQPLSVFFEVTFPNGVALMAVALSLFVFDQPDLVLECYLGGLVTSWAFSQLAISKWTRSIQMEPAGHSSLRSHSGIIREAYPMYVTALVTTLLVSVDVVMLSWFVTPEQVAIYAIALRIVSLVTFPLSGIIHVVSPRYSAAFAEQDIRRVEMLHQKATQMAVWTAFPLIAVVLCLPEMILGLFGSTFQSGTTVLYIVLVGQLANLLVGPIGYLMWMCDMAAVLQKVMIVVLIVNVFLNALLIPSMGVEGAAIATSVALIIKNVWSLWLVKGKFGFLGLFKPFAGGSDVKT